MLAASTAQRFDRSRELLNRILELDPIDNPPFSHFVVVHLLCTEYCIQTFSTSCLRYQEVPYSVAALPLWSLGFLLGGEDSRLVRPDGNRINAASKTTTAG